MTASILNVPADQIPRLKQLWASGLSALECGEELGLKGDPNQIRDAVIRAHQTPAPPKPSAAETYWTDEKVALLKKLHADGLSCSDIAGELGGISRVAVAAKLYRLGLRDNRARAQRPASSAQHPARPTTRSNLPQRVRTPTADPIFKPDGVDGAPAPDDLAIPVEQRKTLLQLTSKDCRFPVGDPKEASFFFCGGSAVPDEPYCAHHARVCFNGRRHRKMAA